MRCRTCGTEIADKALICYRCGTATSEARPTTRRGGRRPSRLFPGVLAGLTLIALSVAWSLDGNLTTAAWSVAVLTGAALVWWTIRRRS